MIEEITVVNFRDETLKLELKYPERSGVIVQDISGLGAGEANINTFESVYIDGSAFNSARLMSRNIVFTLLPMTIPSVEENRHKIYHFFTSKKKVTMRFTISSGERTIDGYVESCTPEIFSELESVQVSILCPDPYFYDAVYTEQALSGYTSLFTFPFSNESLTEDLIVFDDLNTSGYTVINYDGDGDTGVIVKITIKEETSSISITNISTNERMTINANKLISSLGTKFVNLDYIEIGTYIGNRYATLHRNGKSYNIINCLGRHTDWFTIISGANEFYFESSSNKRMIDLRLSYRNVYVGV